MKYAILAAGEGSRLRNEGIMTPKPLIEVCGEPMIDRLIRIFLQNDAEEILIITNNESVETQRHIHALKNKGLPVRLVVKSTSSSMHSFYELMPLLGHGRFCLTTTDTIFREDEFQQYIKAFLNFNGDAFMAVTDYIDDEKPLYVSTDKNLNITGFHNEPVDTTRYISGGIYCMTDHVFPVLSQCIENGMSRMRTFQAQLVNEGKCVKAFTFSKVLDVDHADDIDKAENFLIRNKIMAQSDGIEVTDDRIKGKGRVLLIYRAEVFSPNMSAKDREILDAVGANLQSLGYAVSFLREEDFNAPISTDIVMSMCRSQQALDILGQMEVNGIRVINSTKSVCNCSRRQFTDILTQADIPMPKQYNKETAKFPLWLKKAEGWSVCHEDIQFIESAKQLSSIGAIENYMMFEHLNGSLVKFYGVAGTDYFMWKYISPDNQSKFGCEKHNATLHKYNFSQSELQSYANRCASLLGLSVYGGDCIINESGEIKFIDFNDWPSFSADCINASIAICSLIRH